MTEGSRTIAIPPTYKTALSWQPQQQAPRKTSLGSGWESSSQATGERTSPWLYIFGPHTTQGRKVGDALTSRDAANPRRQEWSLSRSVDGSLRPTNSASEVYRVVANGNYLSAPSLLQDLPDIGVSTSRDGMQHSPRAVGMPKMGC